MTIQLIDRDDITARVISSSFNPYRNTRLDTLQLRYPRIVHADFMTHRVFSRNASSSRAIPVSSMLAREQVFVPNFRYNKPGMQPGENLNPQDQRIAAEIWEEMIEYVAKRCQLLSDKNGLNVHKEWVNRPLEWFGYIDVVVTSTDWENFLSLRDHEAAQDEIQILARKIKVAQDSVLPATLLYNQWHLPYITQADWDYVDFHCDRMRPELRPKEIDLLIPLFGDAFAVIPDNIKLLIAMSAARCCRVSYAKHDGEVSTLEEDIRRCLLLVQPGSPVHASPFEHQATLWHPDYPDRLKSNLRHFAQFRKMIPNEAVSEH